MSPLNEFPLELLQLWHQWRYYVLGSIVIAGGVLAALRKTSKSNATPIWTDVKTANEHTALALDGHAEDAIVAEKLQQVQKAAPKTFTAGKPKPRNPKRESSYDHTRDSIKPLVFYSSLAGTTEAAAKEVGQKLTAWIGKQTSREGLLEPEVLDVSYIELDDYFITPPKTEGNTKYFYLVLLPSYDIDSVLNNFIEHLQETHNDFRIDSAPLSSLVGYSVFGFGDREGWPTEEEGFCYQAKEVDKWLAKLTGRKRAYPLGLGDVRSDSKQRLEEWQNGVQEALLEITLGNGLGEGIPGSGDAVESDEEDVAEDDTETLETATSKSRAAKKTNGSRVDDVEDLGRMITKSEDASETSNGPIAIDFTTYKPLPPKRPVTSIKEMVPASSPTYAALTKQGYSVIGSHSGVKICRWTKSALRGRGSCYKYSFYGIQSHLCMEATPSLSCSNKCVFCWRHGTNPVGTTWRWITDPPEMIYDGITAAHYKKIKMMKGVPGVRAERFAEAMRIRHCALSLVGEPIFYPHINKLLSIMHANRISTFLVCNAQHPEQLATLVPVTQLYVSIDASNKESLRKIDRPLHRDFWERFCACLDILRARRHEQRTVFRLTLVKGFNIEEEVNGYADLVERSLPCFVEIKGVTYCGTSASSAAGLTMQNVPFYAEVCEFVRALAAELQRRNLGYGIAVEHEHSCCVLLASDRFKRNGKWHTRIGFEKFYELVESGEKFGPEDYIDEDPTPEWALWGNGGFDPRDKRVYRKGKKKGLEEVAPPAVQVVEI